jgi:Flp pilus assembly protein TadD
MSWKNFVGLNQPVDSDIRKLKILLSVLLVLYVMASASAQIRPGERDQAAEAVALTNLGFAYSKSSQYTKAVEVLRQAVLLNPTLAEPHYLLGATYNNLGGISRGLQRARRSV